MLCVILTLRQPPILNGYLNEHLMCCVAGVSAETDLIEVMDEKKHSV